MIFDTESTLLARLAAKCAPGSVLRGTFDPVDMTDDTITPVIGQLVLSQIAAVSQTGTNCRALIVYEFAVYCDIYRSTAQQKTDASVLLETALNALVGWEFSPGREVEIGTGTQTNFDGRILRLSFGFSIPAHFVGS